MILDRTGTTAYNQPDELDYFDKFLEIVLKSQNRISELAQLRNKIDSLAEMYSQQQNAKKTRTPLSPNFTLKRRKQSPMVSVTPTRNLHASQNTSIARSRRSGVGNVSDNDEGKQTDFHHKINLNASTGRMSGISNQNPQNPSYIDTFQQNQSIPIEVSNGVNMNLDFQTKSQITQNSKSNLTPKNQNSPLVYDHRTLNASHNTHSHQEFSSNRQKDNQKPLMGDSQQQQFRRFSQPVAPRESLNTASLSQNGVYSANTVNFQDMNLDLGSLEFDLDWDSQDILKNLNTLLRGNDEIIKVKLGLEV